MMHSRKQQTLEANHKAESTHGQKNGGGPRQIARSIAPTPSRPNVGRSRGGRHGCRRLLRHWTVPWPGRTPRRLTIPARTKQRETWSRAVAAAWWMVAACPAREMNASTEGRAGNG
jgi:hypothetical protein